MLSSVGNFLIGPLALTKTPVEVVPLLPLWNPTSPTHFVIINRYVEADMGQMQGQCWLSPPKSLTHMSLPPEGRLLCKNVSDSSGSQCPAWHGGGLQGHGKNLS